ncbi:hypothetical protein ACSTLI_23520, partial [Vibrio parahaemolyticus]
GRLGAAQEAELGQRAGDGTEAEDDAVQAGGDGDGPEQHVRLQQGGRAAVELGVPPGMPEVVSTAQPPASLSASSSTSVLR